MAEVYDTLIDRPCRPCAGLRACAWQVTGKQLQAALRARRIPFNVHGVAFYRKKVRGCKAVLEDASGFASNRGDARQLCS